MTIGRITLAVEDMAAMVSFYDEVFGTSLQALGEPDSFHLGEFFGIALLMCPNEIADVDARQNRHQFQLAMSDLDAVAEAVRHAGGEVRGDDTHDGTRVLSIADPDGNTYEIVAA